MRKWNVIVLPLLLLAGCGSDDPTSPAPVVPSPTATPAPTPTPAPGASSAYEGNWVYRTTILAVDRNCGHSPADIGLAEGPFGVTVASNGTFTLPDGGQGAIDSGGTVTFTLAPGGSNCSTSGTGRGGCRDTDHCDGTSEQSGDVKKWTLARQ